MQGGYHTYLRCDSMAHDIRFCQNNGVKVILNIGGSNDFIGFQNKNESMYFANILWKLFLGGQEEARNENLPRTFG